MITSNSLTACTVHLPPETLVEVTGRSLFTYEEWSNLQVFDCIPDLLSYLEYLAQIASGRLLQSIWLDWQTCMALLDQPVGDTEGPSAPTDGYNPAEWLCAVELLRARHGSITPGDCMRALRTLRNIDEHDTFNDLLYSTISYLDELNFPDLPDYFERMLAETQLFPSLSIS